MLTNKAIEMHAMRCDTPCHPQDDYIYREGVVDGAIWMRQHMAREMKKLLQDYINKCAWEIDGLKEENDIIKFHYEGKDLSEEEQKVVDDAIRENNLKIMARLNNINIAVEIQNYARHGHKK